MFIDVDDTIIDVHGYQKGSGYGYSGGPRTQCLAGHRVHAGHGPGDSGAAAAPGSDELARGAKRLVTDALSTLKCVLTGSRIQDSRDRMTNHPI